MRNNILKYLFLTCAVVSLVNFGASAIAATSEGSFSVRGIGGQTCETVLERLTEANSDTVVAELNGWVAGWLSHANREAADTFDVHPLRSVSAISEVVSRLCAGNPKALLETVMMVSTASVGSGRVEGMSEVQIYTVGDASFSMRNETMQDLQNVLVARGILETKQADGVFGPATQTAIAEFQKLLALPETGRPDPLTLFLAFSDQ